MVKCVIPCAYHHSFTTDASVKGVGIAQAAVLLDDTSMDMVLRHYSRLSEKVEHNVPPFVPA